MKNFLILICLSVLSMPAFSGGITRESGDKSLNFSFSNFSIDDYKYGIGGKYWWSSNIALTGSINGENIKTETTTSALTTQPDFKTTSYGLSIGIEKHFNSSTKLSPYFGGEVYYLDGETNSPSSNINTSSSKWEINALLGAEYAFNKSIAFAAEYSFGYSSIESKSNTTTTTSKGFGLGSGKLILLLYF